jgi:hypothetical protein
VFDIGIGIGIDNYSRQRCSIEFWYFLPVQKITKDIVLVRRSLYSPEETLQNICPILEKNNIIWELVVVPDGSLEFRSNGESLLGSLSRTKDNLGPENIIYDAYEGQNNTEEAGIVSLHKNKSSGWNHMCLTFSCRDTTSITECNVCIIMKGVKVASPTQTMSLVIF